jgi:hypothetical protein
MWGQSAEYWRHESRLIPIAGSQISGNRGQATFRLLRDRKTDPGQRVSQRAPNQLSRGQYVAVCAAPDVDGKPVFDWAKVEWAGTIETFDVGLIPGAEPSLDGQAIASGLGLIFDANIPRGWVMSDGTTGTVLQSPPPANITGANGVIIGNYTAAAGGVFAALRSDCGTSAGSIWTRKRLATHILARCLPAGCPVTTLVSDTNVTTFIEDTTAIESWDVSGQSIGQIFDLIFPRSQGIAWTVRVNSVGLWELLVYALLDEGETGTPLATPVDATLDGLAVTSQPRVVYDTSSVYDEVNVIGGPVVWCGSLAAKDSWITKGWSASAETAYKTGASTMSGYASLPLSKQAERNAQARGGAALSAVFSRLIVGPGTNTGRMKTSATPGVGTPTLDFFPLVQWDSNTGTATVSPTESADPAWPTALIERTIPWERGVKADGTSLGLADDDATPSYLPPLAFARVQTRDTSASEPLWYDLSQEFGRRPGFGLDVDDRAAAIRLVGTPAEWLAKGDWSGMATSSLAPGATTEADVRARLAPILDWRDVVATVAIASAQRIEVRKLRSGSTDGLARKVLRIDMPELQSWWVRQGAIVGMKPKATTTDQLEPDVVAADTHTRNDWPTAERIARLAAAYAFSERATFSVELGNIDNLPAWASIGTMIGQVLDGGGIAQIYTTVEEISYRWAEGRVTVRTDLPPAPAWMARINQAASPQLGGSMASSVIDLQKRVERVEERAQNVPVVAARSPITPEATQIFRLRIDKGNVIATVGGVNFHGVKFNGTTTTSVPTATPSISGVYADGVTAAYLLSPALELTTGTVVWVLNGPYTDAAGVTWLAESFGSIPQNYVAISRKRVLMNVAAGGTAYAYVLWR